MEVRASHIFSSGTRFKLLPHTCIFQDANTMEKPGELEKDENSTLDYQVTLDQTTTNKSRGLVLKITRKLETGDPQDVPITVS